MLNVRSAIHCYCLEKNFDIDLPNKIISILIVTMIADGYVETSSLFLCLVTWPLKLLGRSVCSLSINQSRIFKVA